MQCEPNVIIAVAEEFAKYVDGHDAQAAICIRFNVQDGKDGFIKNGISDIFRRIGVCCHLSQAPFPSNPRSRSILTWRKGSVIPETSCSGLYPVVTKDFRCRTRRGTAWRP